MLYSVDERDYEASIHRVLPFITDDDEQVRSGVISTISLVASHYPESISYLVDAMRHEQADVRQAVMRAASFHANRHGSESTVREHVEQMRNDPSDDVRENWPHAMEHLIDNDRRKSLIRELLDEPDSALRLGAFWQLIYLLHETSGWPAEYTDAIPQIVDGLHDPNVEMRHVTIRLMFSVPMQERAKHVELFEHLAAAENEDPDIQSLAIRHLRAIRSWRPED